MTLICILKVTRSVKKLRAESTAAAAAVVKEVTAHAAPPTVEIQPAVMQLYVKTLSNVSFPLNMPLTATVRDMMIEITKSEGIRPDQMRLIFGGKQLEPAETLLHYNITDHSVVHLVLRLLGGGM